MYNKSVVERPPTPGTFPLILFIDYTNSTCLLHWCTKLYHCGGQRWVQAGVVCTTWGGVIECHLATPPPPPAPHHRWRGLLLGQELWIQNWKIVKCKNREIQKCENIKMQSRNIKEIKSYTRNIWESKNYCHYSLNELIYQTFYCDCIKNARICISMPRDREKKDRHARP